MASPASTCMGEAQVRRVAEGVCTEVLLRFKLDTPLKLSVRVAFGPESIKWPKDWFVDLVTPGPFAPQILDEVHEMLLEKGYTVDLKFYTKYAKPGGVHGDMYMPWIVADVIPLALHEDRTLEKLATRIQEQRNQIPPGPAGPAGPERDEDGVEVIRGE